MKNHRFKLVIIFCTSFLSGCSLFYLAETVALTPLAIVDGVTGTHMARSIDNGVKESLRPKKMATQSIQTELSGKTLYPYGAVAYLNANGAALFKSNEDNQVKKYKWTKSEGKVCIAGDICYELRKKDNTIVYGVADEPLTIKNGDTENLTVLFENAEKQKAEQQAEIERKKAEERLAQQQAEAEQQRLAAEEERCMATPKCRAKKEQEERIDAARRAEEDRRREAAARQQREQSCDVFYSGKAFKFAPAGWLYRIGGVALDAVVLGVNKESGLVSFSARDLDGRTRNEEGSCEQIKAQTR